MASAQVDAEEDRRRIAAALGNDKKVLRDLPVARRASPAAKGDKQRPVVQVTDELALLDQLMQAATYCAKHHDAAGLAEVVERLEQVSGSKFSSGKEARNATHRARLSLQHIGILSEGRLAAMRGQPAVLKELAKAAETRKMDQRVVAALNMLATKRKLTDTLSPDVYHCHQNAIGRPSRVEDREAAAAGRCCSAEPHLSSTWRMKRSHLIPALTEQDIDKLEKSEQHAHESFTTWKQQHDAKTRLQAAQALAEAARKQIMWDQREIESDAAQKQAFAAWLRQKSRQQGQVFPCHQQQGNKAKWISGVSEDSKKKLQDDADGTKRLYQDLDVDPASEQNLLDAIKRGVVVGTHRVPLLAQLYQRYQMEWAWDSRALGEADRKTFLFGGVEENCAGGVLEPFLGSSDPNLTSVAARGAVVGVQH